MSSKDKATEAAQKKAEELGVGVGKAEGSGSGGKVTVGEVEEAAIEANSEPDRLIRVHLVDPMSGSAQGSDGVTYRDGDPVSERHYDEVLSRDQGLGGARIFRKGKAVS